MADDRGSRSLACLFRRVFNPLSLMLVGTKWNDIQPSSSYASFYSWRPTRIERLIAQCPNPRDTPFGHYPLRRFSARIDGSWCILAPPHFPFNKSASPLEHSDFQNARFLALNKSFSNRMSYGCASAAPRAELGRLSNCPHDVGEKTAWVIGAL